MGALKRTTAGIGEIENRQDCQKRGIASVHISPAKTAAATCVA